MHWTVTPEIGGSNPPNTATLERSSKMKRMCVDVTIRLWIEVDDEEVTTTSQLIDEELGGHYILNDDWAVKIGDQALLSANVVEEH
jgi:hypothetical protein